MEPCASKNRWPSLFVGGQGVGKTSLWHQIAEYLGCGIKVAHPVVDSPLDYKGHPYGWITADGTPKAKFIPYGDLEILINTQAPLIYVADDLGQATDVVKAAWMQLLLARHINGHPISPLVTFAACTNRKEDAAGVTRFLEPLKDRFHVVITVKAAVDPWAKWATKNGIAHEVVTWVRMNPQVLDAFKPTSDFSRTPTPRAIGELSDYYKTGLPPELQLRTFASTIGTEWAVNFKAHLEYYTRLQDPDVVLMNPDKADIPQEPVLAYALCGALAAKANRKTASNIMKYAARLDDAGYGEFSMLLIKDAVTRNAAEVMGNGDFCKWAAAHQGDMGL